MIFKSRHAGRKMDIYKCPKTNRSDKSWENPSLRP